jgi:Rieske [2Fe-2S] domain
MRLTLHRTPDVFDLTLMSLLRYGNRPAQTMQLVRERENTETIERDGLRMQRWCPHAGEDLTFATVCDGVLECPRHHRKWDVRTGDCLDGGTVSLRSSRWRRPPPARVPNEPRGRPRPAPARRLKLANRPKPRQPPRCVGWQLVPAWLHSAEQRLYPPNQQPQDWPDGILRGSGA